MKGVGTRVADIIARRAGVNRIAKIGTLADAQIEEIEKLITTYPITLPPGRSTASSISRPATTCISSGSTWTFP